MNKKLMLLLGCAALLGFNTKSEAAGFALIEQSVSSMGNAYAGGAAIAEDASTIFFNPAGITRLPGNQLIIGAHGVFPKVDFHNHHSLLFPEVAAGPVPPSNYVPGKRLSGNNGGNAGQHALVGNFYWTRQICDSWHVGLGITSPFGLITKYDDHWVGRYHALRSSLLTIDINPVVAYRVNRCWSVGGGFRAVYAHAKLSNAVDYGTIAWLATLTQGEAAPIIEEGLNELGFLPQKEDGHAHLKGNAWGWGGNLGILFEPWCGTRFGVNWRSQVMLHITGTERFSELPALIKDPSLAGPLAAFFEAIREGAAIDTRAKAHINLPDIVQISAYHEINSCWAVMGDISWTHWRLLKDLRFRFHNPAQPDAITTLKWRNALRYSLGATFSPHCDWKIRAGIAYDQTPIKHDEYRTPRIPDNDRFWVAAGLGYQWSQFLHFDLAYAHLFVRKPRINKADFKLPEDYIRGGLRGDYNPAYTDIVSAQVVFNF